MDSGIAILGWGSLTYELEELKNHVSSEWKDGGPQLPIEFSRVSSSRDKALTLVIDEENGVDTPTQYIMSSRPDPKKAAHDLRKRERTVPRQIGIFDPVDEVMKCKSSQAANRIREWTVEKNLRAVVWTDLPSNFPEKSLLDGEIPFSIDAALEHLASLNEKATQKAKQYIRNAPSYVETPLRDRLRAEGWPEK